MDRGVRYTVVQHDNRGTPVFSVMRGCIVLIRYADQDTAYAVRDHLGAHSTGEYHGVIHSHFMDR